MINLLENWTSNETNDNVQTSNILDELQEYIYFKYSEYKPYPINSFK